MILPYTFLNHTTKNRLPNLKSRIWEPVLRYLCLFLYRKINRIYLSANIFLRLETEINNLLNVIVVLLFAAPTVEIARQADHVIDETVLLIHIAQSGILAAWRSPALSSCLPSGIVALAAYW